MKYCLFPAVVLLALLVPMQPAAAMDLSIRVQYEADGDAARGIDVQCVFNPGTSFAHTVLGTTDSQGMVYFSHDVVTAVEEIRPLVVSSPRPNPARSTAVFGLSGGSESYGNLSLFLFDLRGRRVGHGSVAGGGFDLPRSLASGTYFYRVMDGGRIRATGKFAVLGELDRVRFETATRSEIKRSASAVVEILIPQQRSGLEEYYDTMVLADGHHDLDISLTAVDCEVSDCSDCEKCGSYMEWIARRIFETGAVTYFEVQSIVIVACEHLSEPAYGHCFNMIYPNEEMITTELILGTPWTEMCFFMGYCLD